jgi:hypothetical protein
MIGAVIRRLAPFVVLLLATVAAGVASASRIEVGPGEGRTYTGSDAVGKVTLFYSSIDIRLTSPHPGEMVTLSGLRFANECSRTGTKVPGTITVGNSSVFAVTKHRSFRYDAHGFIVQGALDWHHAVLVPRKITGTIEWIRDCDGDTQFLHFTLGVLKG